MHRRSIAALTERMLADCKERDVRTLVDLGLTLAEDNVLSLRGAPCAFRPAVRILGCTLEERMPVLFPGFSNLYDGVYASLADLPKEAREGAVCLGARYLQEEAAQSIELAVTMLEFFDTVYFVAPGTGTAQGAPYLLLREMNSLWAEFFSAEDEVLIRLEKREQKTDIKIFVAAHKPCAFPDKDIYVPLWLGPQGENPGAFFDDKQQPSLAHLNHRINECTGLYAAWKHAQADVKGLVHYRRFFLSERQLKGGRCLIDGEEIIRLLKHADILVYRQEFFALPVREQMISSGITRERAARAEDVFRELIAKHQPEYLRAFDRVLAGYGFYPCNMFIAGREVFDAYCAFLFSFLIRAAQTLDFDDTKDANRRTAGFFAERMLTVWLMEQNLRIRELEVTRIP